MNTIKENLIREYNAISAIKESDPVEFTERCAKLREELELHTARMKNTLVDEMEILVEVARNVSRAGLLYIKKDPYWRRELIKSCTAGPYIWIEGGHIYYAYTTADIEKGPSRERLKRQSVFTKDLVQTNITPIKNSIERLKTQTNEEMYNALGYVAELTKADPSVVKTIRTVREITGLGLLEAKEIVDSVPIILSIKNTPEEAQLCKEKLEKEGAKVVIHGGNES